ncbi:Uncharacterised protein [Mycoplasmopsis californica]|nr:Uncharacterised protein [Mycoplasmopsis californica]
MDQQGQTLEDYYKATNTTSQDFEEAMTKNATESVTINTLESLLNNQLKIKASQKTIDLVWEYIALQYNKEVETIKTQIPQQQIDAFAKHIALIDALVKEGK